MKNITGHFLRPDGSPAAGASLKFLLQGTATNPSLGHFVHTLYTVTLDQNGSIPAGTVIEASDELNPNTSYRVVVVDQAFGKCFDEVLNISGPSPVNLDLIP